MCLECSVPVGRLFRPVFHGFTRTRRNTVLYALRDDPANMLIAFFERLRLKLESLPVDDFALISFKAGSGLKPCLAMPSVMSKFRSIQDQLKMAAAEKASQELHDLLKDVLPVKRAALNSKGKESK